MDAAATTSSTVPADEAQLRRASALLGVPFVRLVGQTIPQAVLELIPEAVARESGMIAYDQETLPSGKKVVRIAVADPEALENEAPAPILDLHARKGLVIEVALAPKGDVAEVFAQYARFRQATSPATANRPHEAAPKPASAPKTTKVGEQPKVKKSAATKQLPRIDLTDKTIPKEVLERIPQETAQKYQVVVFGITPDGKHLQIALAQPDNPQVQDFLSFVRDRAHLQVDLFEASAESIAHGLAQYASPAKTMKEPTIKDYRPAPASLTASDARQKPLSDRAADNQTSLSASPSSQPSTEPPPPLVEPTPKIDEEAPVPESAATKPETNLLVPVAADVERDLGAVVGQPVKTIADLETIVRTGFIPKIVGAIVLLAAEMSASDIHMQADDENLLVRYRVDGLLSDIVTMPLTLQAPVVSRIKILAKLKIDEQRVPQDGRFDVMVNDKQIDLRVSTFPTVKGEKVVIRLLDKSRGMLKLEQLGFVGSRLERLRKEIAKPYGVILSTGPTGSGKSTSLYAIITEIKRPEINIVTLEDPVEYEIGGISQAQIRPKIGFGFAEGLRSILRQDPNVIMVGEVRDLETASMMTHAALTGHLVLSTLHTNDASGAMPRLVDMGVEPFLITSAMNAIIAQRLVRRLCDKCRVSWQPDETIIKQVETTLKEGNNQELLDRLAKGTAFWKAVGCDACHNGYKGRIGIFEVLVMSETIEELIVKKASASEVAKTAVEEGMVTMEQDGLLKVLGGLTTLDEVLRVTKTE